MEPAPGAACWSALGDGHADLHLRVDEGLEAVVGYAEGERAVAVVDREEGAL